MAASNKETVRKVQEAWNQKRFDDLDQYFAADFKANGNDPSGPPSLAAAKASNAFMNQVFSERRVEILDLLEDGDKIFMRNRATGKHTGESWMGAPADGKAYEIESWSMYRFRDGKIVESWGLNDGMRLIMQLGGQLPQRPVAAAGSR
ncbi:MAG TPA: ester cyclase [Verrucomicrobiae bacterium]|nr:ester cyclase [Verrucomicrobiae bacterium]